MKEFRYKALAPSGQTIVGLRAAPSVEELASALVAQDLILLSSRPTLGSMGFSLGKGANRRELQDFTLNLSTTLSAGIPIVQVLVDYEKDSASQAFKDVVADIRRSIAGGNKVSESLAVHPKIFPEIYVSIVEAGETTGNLDRAFADLVSHLEWEGDLQAQTKQMMLYPALLATATLGLFILMTFFVIPQFREAFSDQAFKMPLITVKVLAFGNFISTWWPLLLGLTIASIIGIRIAKRTSRGKYYWDQMMLRLPIIGNFVSKLALSRFSRYFSLLFGSGLDLLRVLQLLQNVVGNEVMKRDLTEIRNRVTGGSTLQESFGKSELFPPLVQRLIAAGEKTGSLDETLIKASEHIDKELPRALKQAYTVLEAVVLVFLGSMIAVCALSMLLPIFQMRAEMG